MKEIKECVEGSAAAPHPRHLAPQPLASSPPPFLSTPGVPTSTPRSVRFPRPGLGPAFGVPAHVVERKSKTGLLQRSSPERSWILNRSIPLPLSLRTSAHKMFCRLSQSGQHLKKDSASGSCKRTTQHLAVGCFFVCASDAIARPHLVVPRSEPLDGVLSSPASSVFPGVGCTCNSSPLTSTLRKFHQLWTANTTFKFFLTCNRVACELRGD